MPTVKSKKQAPMPGPNSAAYKKLLAAGTAAKSTSAPKNNHKAKRTGAPKKHRKSPLAHGSLKSKQMTVERMKRAIWTSAQKINESIIRLAGMGNLPAAKELYDFADVYDVLSLGDEPAPAAAAPPPAPAAAPAAPAACATTLDGMPIERIERFFDHLGIPPSTAEPVAALVE